MLITDNRSSGWNFSITRRLSKFYRNTEHCKNTEDIGIILHGKTLN